MIPAPHLRWLLQHVRSKCFMTEDLTEPHGRGWSDSPGQALMGVDPVAFAARLRQSLTPSLLSHCRLVQVAFGSDVQRSHNGFPATPKPPISPKGQRL
jgi:hypothetical protein